MIVHQHRRSRSVAVVVASLSVMLVLTSCQNESAADSESAAQGESAARTEPAVKSSPAAQSEPATGSSSSESFASSPSVPSSSRAGSAGDAVPATSARPALGAAGAAPSAPFPGDAKLSRKGGPADSNRTIAGSILAAGQLSLGDGWFHSTDSWNDEKPPAAVVNGGAPEKFSVRGPAPGMVAAYQIYESSGTATTYWIGAKFYSPLAGTNKWSCLVYRGNPRTDGALDDTSPYTCRWTDYRGWNPAPTLTVARWSASAPPFPGEARPSKPLPKYPRDAFLNGVITFEQGRLGDGWFRPTNSWSDATAPMTSIPPGPGAAFWVRGQQQGVVLSYQIYDADDKPTGYWIGAKLWVSNNSVIPNQWECRLYFGDPRQHGRSSATAPYRCSWKKGTTLNPTWTLTVSRTQ